VRAVGALAAARLQQPTGASRVQDVRQEALAGLVRDQPASELAQNAVVEARVGEGEGEEVLPVDPRPDRVRGLAIGEALAELHQRDERQPPRRIGRLAERGVEIGEAGVVEHRTEPVAQEKVDVAPREGGAGDERGLFGDGWNGRLRAKGHGRCSSRRTPSTPLRVT
jgi:hypothetical protein